MAIYFFSQIPYKRKEKNNDRGGINAGQLVK